MLQFFVGVGRGLDASILNAAKWFDSAPGHILLCVMCLGMMAGTICAALEENPTLMHKIDDALIARQMRRYASQLKTELEAWRAKAWKDGGKSD